MVPNAITALALCFGLTGVSLAIKGEWEKALGAVVFAGVLDGFDGRIARLLRAQSRFGAELDSLSDNIAFGTAPALILFLWSLQNAPRFGWIAALALAVCCALRLARFNARIDVAEQPHKSAGFNTGRVGTWTYAHKNALRLSAAVLGGLILVFWSQPTAWVVVGIALFVVVLLAVIEFLSSPPKAAQAAESAT